MYSMESLRHTLHANAELSGAEKRTNEIINDFLRNTSPDLHLTKVGGYGVAALYKRGALGKRILIRADIDGLNIPEAWRPYSHRCGHDGHAAILCGLAERLGQANTLKNEIVLLFQPAEETGEGAQAVMEDRLFHKIRPDVAFALHNLPGYEKNMILLKEGCFAAASEGVKLVFEGATAHASQPETGNSPQALLAKLMCDFNNQAQLLKRETPFAMMTMTHATLGEETFGVAPGKAEVWLTLRSYDDHKLKKLENECIDFARKESEKRGFRLSYSIHEAFAATINSCREVKLVEQAARELNLSVCTLEAPFRWSEDFGRFSAVCPTVLFGIGTGINQAPLHSLDYDFEDEIMKTGVELFEKIIMNGWDKE